MQNTSPIKSTAKDVSSVQKQINVEVPAEEVKKALDRAYQKIGQKVHLKGFRPGKAPRKMLEEYYRQDAESEAVGILLETTYPKALQETDIHPIAQPKITVTTFGVDKDFAYEALVDVRPIIEVKDYKGQSFEKDSNEIEDKEIDDQIKNLQERMAQLAPLTEDRSTKAFDVVVMDYQGYLEGSPVDSLVAKDSVAEIGKGYLFPELEEGLLNLNRGDKKEVEVQFPEGWADKNVAGKKVKIAVELKDIKEKKLPEVNDDFAKDLGFESLAILKTKIVDDMKGNKEQWVKNRLRRQVLEKFVEKNAFDVPPSMIESELQHMFKLFENNLANQGTTLQKAGVTQEDFYSRNRDEAAFRVKGALIFDEIAKKENIVISMADVDQRITEMAVAAGQAPEAWKQYYQKNNMLSGIAGAILEEKVLDFVLSESKISTKVSK